MPKIPLLLFLFILLSIPLLKAQGPSITTCDGKQDFCLIGTTYEICAKIEVPPTFNQEIDHFEIDWGVLPVEIVSASSLPPSDLFHVYDFSTFFETCAGEISYFVTLYTYLTDGTKLNNSFKATFRNPPKIEFQMESTTFCVGERITFGYALCSEADTILNWNYGDQTSGLENFHEYSTANDYNVTVTVANGCDTLDYILPISIIENAIAQVSIPDSIPDISGEYHFCLKELPDTVYIQLNGSDSSRNVTNYHWEVIGNPGDYFWIDPAIPPNQNPTVQNPKIGITRSGMYQFILTGDNPCQIPSRDTIVVHVYESTFNTPDSVTGACDTLIYTPIPFDPNLKYCMDGETVEEFPIFLPPGSHSLVVKSANPCTQPYTEIIHVDSPSEAEIDQENMTLCSADGDTTLSAYPNGLIWRINGIPFNGTITPSIAQDGQNIITYGNPPCIREDTIYITYQNVEVEITTSTQPCLGDMPIALQADKEPGIFSGPGVISPGMFKASSADIYPILYTYSHPEDASCVGIDSIQLDVIDPVVDFEVVSCDSFTLSFETSNATPFDGIHWDFGDGDTSIVSTPSHTYPNEGSFSVEVTTFTGNCKATISDTIKVEKAPEANFNLSYDAKICSPLMVSVENSSSVGTLKYEWYVNDKLEDTSYIPDNFLLEAFDSITLFEIKLLVIGECHTAIHIDTIWVNPQPTSKFGTNLSEYCSGDTIYLSNNAMGNPHTIRWFKNGSPFPMDFNAPSFVHITSVTDTLEICLEVENDCGKDIHCRNIIVKPTDVEAFFHTSAIEVCRGDTVFFESFSTNGVPVLYHFGDSAMTQSSEPNTWFVYQDTGTYTITLQALGCGFDQFQTTIKVIDAPVADFTGPTQGCTQTPMQFFEQAPMAESFHWDFGNGITSTHSNPVTDFDSAGSYEVCLTVYLQNDCSHILCKTIDIQESPSIVPNEVVAHISCYGQTDGKIILDDFIVGGFPPFYASAIGPNSYREEGLRFENLKPGFYSVSIRDAIGCTTTLEREIIEPDSLFLDILQDTISIKLGEEIVLSTSTNASAPIYQWYPDEGLSCPDCPEPLGNPLINTLYTAQVTDLNGCIATDTIIIEVEIARDVYIPNSFTPNGDGINDIFRIRSDNPAVEKISLFQVYDRWGGLLFQASDYHPTDISIGWDGTFKGKDMPPGVYVYKAQILFIDMDEPIQRAGNVTLIR